MINKNILTLFFLVIHTIAFGQLNSIKVENGTDTIGIIPNTNHEIIAITHEFPDPIIDLKFHNNQDIATVQILKNNILLKTGSFINYDLKHKKVNWSKPISYKNTTITQFDNFIVQFRMKKSTFLNFEKGFAYGSSNKSIFFIDTDNNVGIGYHKIHRNKKTLVGFDIDLQQNDLWEREITNKFGWSQLQPLSDSTYMVFSSGLHTLNINTGKGWDYDAIITKIDPFVNKSKYLAKITLVLAVGAISVSLSNISFNYSHSPQYAGHVSNPDLVTNIHSNLASDDQHYFFASKMEIAKINKSTGHVQWFYNLPKKHTSNSHIEIFNDVILLFNKGLATHNNGLVYCGKPFISAFNKSTGEQLYLNKFKDKKDVIVDFKINEDTLLLVRSKTIGLYNLITGKLIKENTLNGTSPMTQLISNETYIRKDSTFHQLFDSKNNDYLLATKSGDVLILNENFNYKQKIKAKEIYKVTQEMDDVKLIKNGEKLFILSDNNLIGELNTSIPFQILGHKLFGIKENKLFEIDLMGLLR